MTNRTGSSRGRLPGVGVLAGIPRSEGQRWRTERMVQRVRSAATVLALGLTWSLGGGPGGGLWAAVALLAGTVALVEVGLRRPAHGRSLRRLGWYAFTGDAAATAVTLALTSQDPTDPVVTLTVLLGLEAAVRWQLAGALLGGLLGAGMAATWLRVAYEAAFAGPPPTQELVLRAGSILLMVTLVGAMVRELERSRHRAATVLELTPELVVTLDTDGRVASANPAAAVLLGHRPEDVVGRAWRELTADVVDGDDPLLAAATDGLVRARLRHADGAPRWFEFSVRDEPVGGRRYLVGRDITTRRAAERERSVSEQRYRALFVHNPDAVFAFDLDARIADVNPAAETLFRRPRTALLGSDALAVIAPEYRDDARAALGRTLAGQPQDVEVVLVFPDGGFGHVDANLLPIMVDGEVVGVFGMARDVTERRRREAYLEYRASHDLLTGLANRAVLHQHLAEAAAGGQTQGVLFLDLDGFKAINDTYGHAGGDQVLVEVARRLQSAVREQDLVSRFAGDEFCVALRDADAATVQHLGERIARTLTGPIHLDAAVVHVGASIGAALLRPGEDPARTLQRADAAMYTVKEHRRLEPAGEPDLPLLLAT